MNEYTAIYYVLGIEHAGNRHTFEVFKALIRSADEGQARIIANRYQPPPGYSVRIEPGDTLELYPNAPELTIPHDLPGIEEGQI